MSQEKVDRYKSEKANRRKTMKRAKIKNRIYSVVGGLVCVVIVGWIGYSGYGYYQSQKTVNITETEVDVSAITDYYSSSSSTDE